MPEIVNRKATYDPLTFNGNTVRELDTLGWLHDDKEAMKKAMNRLMSHARLASVFSFVRRRLIVAFHIAFFHVVSK